MMTRTIRSPVLRLLLVTFVLLSNKIHPVIAEEEASSSTTTTKEATTPKVKEDAPLSAEQLVDSFNAKDHTDWGSYYDPQNIFCGKYDCYKILGFDYENYGKEKPSTKIITKRYRALSREWHPDKSKRRNAKDRFVKIARAYEVLVDVQLRKEYDMLRYDQEAYFQKYGAGVLFHYAPKSDTLFVFILLTILANAFSWWAQKQKWQRVANRLIQATIEDWTPSQGGSNESKVLRERALEELANQTAAAAAAAAAVGSEPQNGSTNSTNKKSIKLSARDKKAKEVEALRPIVEALVLEMKDFGAGFHQPTYKDLLSVRMMYYWPISITKGIIWNTKYMIRRLQKLEYSEEEKSVLTERAVGPVTWELATEEERQEMMERELWILQNLADYKEEQEIKTWSKADQKMYAKMKKRGGGMGGGGGGPGPFLKDD